MAEQRREPFNLPVKIAKNQKEDLIKATAAKCVATTKKVAIDALNGKATDMNSLLFDELEDLYDRAYAAGLKHMDQMHQKIEPKY